MAAQQTIAMVLGAVILLISSAFTIGGFILGLGYLTDAIDNTTVSFDFLNTTLGATVNLADQMGTIFTIGGVAILMAIIFGALIFAINRGSEGR